MSSPFQRKFSAKSPLRHNHGNENARSFGGYHQETGEVIDARTGRTPSEQEAINLAEDQKKLDFADEYNAYGNARDSWRQWNETENQFGFGDLEYPKQAEFDSIRAAWENAGKKPVQPIQVEVPPQL